MASDWDIHAAVMRDTLRIVEERMAKWDPNDEEHVPDDRLLLALGMAESIRNQAWAIEKRLLRRAQALASRGENPWLEEGESNERDGQPEPD